MNTHEEIKRIHNDGGTAVLFLHGILGTPRHFDFLLPLIPEDWSLWSCLLPGHGGSTGQFGASSMAQWKSAVREALTELSESHERVFIAGHSMGSLLAVLAALERPEKVAGIFALAMPLRIRFTFRAALSCLHVAYRAESTDTPYLRATRDSCGIRLSKNPLAYLSWIPRFTELFSLSREIRPKMRELSVPYRVIFSAKDELVSKASLKYCKPGQSSVLPDSGHYFYGGSDLNTIKSEFKSFIE